jgi:predicted metal-dependent enzyme (double-stranded beta helix superfamily)
MTTIAQLISRSRELLCYRHDDSNILFQELVTLMNGITPDSLPPSVKIPDSNMSGWHKDDLYTTAHFSLDMFTISQGQVIPLHDHPSMWVLMRALRGHLRVVAYDWVRQYPWGGLARPSYDLALSDDNDTLVIGPDRGNIHQVVADKDCAFLDLTFPPYSDQQRRGFHYYRVAGEKLVNGERLTRLVSRIIPP